MAHSVGHDDTHGKGEVKRITIILSVLTIVELLIGFWMIGMESEALRLACKGAIIILMLAKAFYIVAYFMHLKHELRSLIMTIVVPLLLFIWFIIAFLADGNSFLNLRNTYDPYFKEQSTIKVEPKKHGNHGAAHDAAHDAADTTKTETTPAVEEHKH